MKRLTWLLVISVAGVAFGYVLPGVSILRRLANARDDLQLGALRVEGSATFFGNGAREAASALNLPTERTEIALDGVFSVKFPNRCRFDVSSPEGGKGASALNHGKKRVEGTEIATAATVLQEVCSLLAVKSGGDGETRAAMDRHLRSLGIESGKTSLSRYGGKVAYVLGDPADGSAQFWVYKDSFLPARVKTADWDVRFIDYSSAATGEWFPRTIELARGGELQLRFTGAKADTRSSLSDRLF
ncbi:MAG: hypothetical protein ACT4TC_12590 [Myxococcaceae bacterium]